MKQLIFFYIVALVVVYTIGAGIGYQWGKSEVAAAVAPLDHDLGRTPIVFDRFCDGWPDDPTPLRCDQILWCWTHHGWETIDWPLAEAIPFLKKLEERSW
jgi:hypothetical protein